MLLLFALLFAAPEDLADKLRHLDSAAAAWAPSPAPDASRIAFLTTLFGTRQAASVPGGGGYPNQLTDEPGGVLAVRYVPSDTGQLLALAVRKGHRRIVLVDEQGAPATEIDSTPGDQYLGGFARDGKRLFYAVAEGDKISLKIFAVDAKKSIEVAPPPPAAGTPVAAGTVSLAEGLTGLFALGPPSPDGRGIVASVKRGKSEALVLVDIASARGEVITDGNGRFRQPRFAPDGKTLYVLTDAGRGTLGVDSITLTGKVRKAVYVPPQDLQAFAISDDGHRLAVAAEAGGETLFSLLELPSLRAQPLAAPPSGALAQVLAGDSPLVWDRTGERLFFAWRLADDTTDVWELRFGYGTALRVTRSPRPGLPRGAIVRPAPQKIGDAQGWVWRPPDVTRPRVAIVVSSTETRPVFDKRIAALNFAGLEVVAVNGPGAQARALSWLKSADDVDPSSPLLLDFDGVPVDDAARWGGIVWPRGEHKAGLQLDADQPDLNALVKYARRGGSAL